MRFKIIKGFTLVELTVIIVIIGVLAAFAVPRYRDAAERSKAREAFNYLASVRASQERFHARQHTYAGAITSMDMRMGAPKYFKVGQVTAGNSGNIEDSWSLTLTRQGSTAGYGAYTVTFTEQGFDVTSSMIAALPEINPM
ncbi:MAG: prepilin-type N-terminal cleavage/methylation domain-containing protein [Nitrospirae bacterium]|nr:prepilin-type N-terminal cleavage/methylation domain-containing protein [Nitrospirota bacterium]